MSSLLHEICEKTRTHVAACKQALPEAALRERMKLNQPPRGFKTALDTTIAEGGTALIAEIKKASPSRGLIRENFNPPELAKAYRDGGATCLSVLTDVPHFLGSIEFLPPVSHTVELPILRKDFMVDTYQVTEARAFNADCILLIMAALDDSHAKEIESAALELGMDVLIEVHDEAECERATTHLRSRLLGVNNRNLSTLEVDLSISQRLAAQLPADYTLVCESGIQTHADIAEMQSHGLHAFLVGESLMRQADVTLATQQLLGQIPGGVHVSS